MNASTSAPTGSGSWCGGSMSGNSSSDSAKSTTSTIGISGTSSGFCCSSPELLYEIMIGAFGSGCCCMEVQRMHASPAGAQHSLSCVYISVADSFHLASCVLGWGYSPGCGVVLSGRSAACRWRVILLLIGESVIGVWLPTEIHTNPLKDYQSIIILSQKH